MLKSCYFNSFYLFIMVNFRVRLVNKSYYMFYIRFDYFGVFGIFKIIMIENKGKVYFFVVVN